MAGMIDEPVEPSQPSPSKPTHPTRSVFGVLPLSERSSHVMPTLDCARAGIYGCGLLYTQELRFATQPA